MATLKKLAQASPTSDTTLYTSPTNGTLVKQVIISNAGAAPTTFFLSHVNQGGSSSSSNRICAGVTVSPDGYGGPTVIDIFAPMTVGQFLSGYTVAANCVITVTGVEF